MNFVLQSATINSLLGKFAFQMAAEHSCYCQDNGEELS